jgi:hypothetical protein
MKLINKIFVAYETCKIFINLLNISIFYYHHSQRRKPYKHHKRDCCQQIHGLQIFAEDELDSSPCWVGWRHVSCYPALFLCDDCLGGGFVCPARTGQLVESYPLLNNFVSLAAAVSEIFSQAQNLGEICHHLVVVDDSHPTRPY